MREQCDWFVKTFIKKYRKEINLCFNLPEGLPEQTAGLIIPPREGIAQPLIGWTYEVWLRVALRRSAWLYYGAEQYYYPGGIHRLLMDKNLRKHALAQILCTGGDTLYSRSLLASCFYFGGEEWKKASIAGAEVTAYMARIPWECKKAVKSTVYHRELEALGRGTDLNALVKLARNSTLSEISISPSIILRGTRGQINGIGDLLLGGTLLDIKCVTKCDYRDGLRQLLVYWMLDRLSPEPYGVKDVGLWFPRYRRLLCFKPMKLTGRRGASNLERLIRKVVGRIT